MKISLIIFFFLLSLNSYTQSRVDLEKKRANTLKEITEAENLLNTVKQNKSESIEFLNLLDKKINT